ncbi:MAG: dephospho-CoA kinase [Chlorobiaceae bacterium]|nr:dephospho-CoA kinase [Chlorobiaceae bacterium]NTW73820.1 dephospho-CoA kinase [Chlorobiaceae bacterium]
MAVRPLLVGVTGGIGSGKSTVCSILAGLGCELFEADRVARELQLSDAEVIDGIVALFGPGVYSRDASGALCIDRRSIAAEVFSDRGKLDALNALIHPKVFQAFDREVERCRRQGRKILCKEAAIIFESGREGDLDRIVVVAADDGLRVARAVSRGLGSRQEVLKRMQAQWPQEKLVERADYVIWNNGSVEELRSRTGEVFRNLVDLVESGSYLRRQERQ